MKSSVYISSEKIEVIGYRSNAKRVKIKAYASAPLKTGATINGKIIDHDNLVHCLSELRKRYPSLFRTTSLIVDGNSILSRHIKTPKLSKRNYNRLIRDEFSDSAEKREDLVCDFYRIAGEKRSGGRILACAAEKTLVESYMDVFKEAGIKLSSISVGVQAVESYISSRTELHNKTFVVNIVDGLAMLSMIFVNAENVFISRVRLYGDSQEEIVRDILKNLLGLTKFTKSEKIDDITHSLYLGLGSEDISLLQAINPNDEMLIEALKINVSCKKRLILESLHFVLLNTLQVNGGIDLLRGYGELKRLTKPKSRLLPWLLGILCIVTAFAVYSSVMLTRITAISEETEAISRYLNDTENLRLSEEIDEMKRQTARYNNAVAQVSAKEDADSALPAVSKALLELIESNAGSGITLNSIEFNEGGGILRISCTSITQPEGLKYVEALSASKLVSAVNYTGFIHNEERGYSFSIELEPVVVDMDEEGAK